jgi:hypothetical protein
MSSTLPYLAFHVVPKGFNRTSLRTLCVAPFHAIYRDVALRISPLCEKPVYEGVKKLLQYQYVPK